MPLPTPYLTGIVTSPCTQGRRRPSSTPIAWHLSAGLYPQVLLLTTLLFPGTRGQVGTCGLNHSCWCLIWKILQPSPQGLSQGLSRDSKKPGKTVFMCQLFCIHPTSASWEHQSIVYGTEYCGVDSHINLFNLFKLLNLFTSTYSSHSSKRNMSVTMTLRLKLTKASFLALSSFSYMNMKMFLQVFFSPKQIKNIYFKGLWELNELMFLSNSATDWPR